MVAQFSTGILAQFSISIYNLRHNMSAINTSINGKEVRNIKPLIAVRGIARREIKAKSL